MREAAATAFVATAAHHRQDEAEIIWPLHSAATLRRGHVHAFEQRGVLNPEVGRRYRDTILAQGRSIEADRLLEAFLGRAPSNEAFLRRIGL